MLVGVFCMDLCAVQGLGLSSSSAYHKGFVLLLYHIDPWALGIVWSFSLLDNVWRRKRTLNTAKASVTFPVLLKYFYFI